MARKTNNDGIDNIKYDSEYFEKCWSKFTALTDEERQNLCNRAIAFKTYKKKLMRQKMNREQKDGVSIMYKLKIKDMIYIIPKENICALAISKFFDIGGRWQSDLNTQEGAIEYLKSLGVEIQEDN